MTKTLESPPGLLGLYAKAGLGALPIVGGRSGGDVPERELELPGVEIDRVRVAKYARVCGFGLRDAIPPTYPHILAFPLQMALMTDGSFPFPAIGMVHLSNRITQHRPIRSTETFDLRVAVTGGPPHPAGRLVQFTSEARIGDELVWESLSGYLSRGGGDKAAAKKRRKQPADPPTEAIWRVPGDTGRRYAEVSGDRNPIHMHDLTAKLFGFKRAIAHGMWTKARALAALDGRLADAFTVDVSFQKPLFLPATVEFATDEKHFAVRARGGEIVHLRGELS